MSALYVETSAVLAWLFGEGTAPAVLSAINEADAVFSSTLTEVEVRRTLVRSEGGGVMPAAAAAHVLGVFETISRQWTAVEISADVRARASRRFPVEPIRTLDAIHLATALELLRVVQELQVLSLDRRVVDNLEPLGLGRAAAP